MRTRPAVSMLMLMMLTLLGCGLPKTKYYVVESPHAPATLSPTIPRRITVARFRANDMLQDDRILYRESGNQVNFYEYQRWASPPVDLVTQYIMHRLKDSAVFSTVSSPQDGLKTDYTLQGRVRSFEEWDRGKDVSARVALEAELLDNKSRSILWRDEVECTRPITTRTVPAVVQGIEQCLDKTTAQLIGSMQSRMAKGE